MTPSPPPWSRDFRGDTRGLGIGIVAFAAMIVIAGLLFILFNDALSELFPMARSQTSSQQATDQINLAESIWGAILFYMLVLAMLFILARSVIESRRPG